MSYFKLPDITKNIQQISQYHIYTINHWKNDGIDIQKNHSHELFNTLEENLAQNFMLWDTEDKARRDDLGHEFVYQAKREIDRFNQQRNNCIETMDDHLFFILNPSIEPTCPVHSETPGMIIDRLAILALKYYHMECQTKRIDVNKNHITTCNNKLQIIKQQSLQLQQCLNELCNEIQQKKRTFKLYRQFKMYNDPSLNPQLYNTKTHD